MLIKVGTEKKPETLFFCEICTFTISFNTNKNDVSLPKSESKKNRSRFFSLRFYGGIVRYTNIYISKRACKINR